MKRGAPAAILLGILLVACALALARLAATAGVGGVELARDHVERVDSALEERLARGDLDLLVQWFAPAVTSAPSEYRDLDSRVRAAFAAIERAAPARVRSQILTPEVDAEARRHAEALGLAPFRARRIIADGWSDTVVWSTLRVVVPGRGASVVRAVTPDLAPALQALIAAAVREIEAPRRARIALSAPPGHARLRELLRTIGDVRDIEFDADAVVPEDVDVLWWIAEVEPGERHSVALEALVERGGSAVVGASRFAARIEGTELVLDDTGPNLASFLGSIGILVDDAPLLEAPREDVRERGAAWTWHVVRSIGTNQDFRAFGAQPNGTLGFQAPTALRPNAERLRERGAEFVSLATSSERCFTLAAGTRRVEVAELAGGTLGTAEPPRTLLALIAPHDPTRGSVVVASSASLFRDRGLGDEAFVHADVVRVLIGTLGSADRRVLAAVAKSRPPPITGVTDAERWTARAVCIALAPILLLSMALVRGAFGSIGTARGPLLLIGIAACAVGLVGTVAALLGPRIGLDPSRDGARALGPQLADFARESAGSATTITAAFSVASDLPPEMRPLANDLERRCAALARTTPNWSYRELRPTDDDATPGLRRLSLSSSTDESQTSREFFASVVIERGTARRVLEFSDPASFDHAEFRLALALRDVVFGKRARIAFASEPARITPAEALELYQRRGLFAPGTGDPFAAARALLTTNGFEVASLDPSRAVEALDSSTLLVWMQPRRDATPGVEILARHLARGGRALLAAQQHRIRPRQRAERGSSAAIWPEPLFPDVDRGWLPALGVRVAPELVLDAENGVLPTLGTRERDGRVESVTMDLANPLVVRSTPTQRPTSAFTTGVGDLILPSPARIELDAERLRSTGLNGRAILETSDRAWTVPWSGGDVLDSAFTSTATTREPLILGALVTGQFPALSGAVSAVIPGVPGQLLVLGASEPFTDARLRAPGFDHARWLLQSCTALALEPELAAILARRPSVGGYRALGPRERMVARAATSVAGPLFVLALGLAWRMRRMRAASWRTGA